MVKSKDETAKQVYVVKSQEQGNDGKSNVVSSAKVALVVAPLGIDVSIVYFLQPREDVGQSEHLDLIGTGAILSRWCFPKSLPKHEIETDS